MITCKCRISYPALFEPKLNPSQVLKYSCSLLIPKSDVKGLADIRAAIDKAIEKGKEKLWKGKVPKFKNEPLRDGDVELEEGDKTGKEYVGHYFINCSSNEAPGVVGKDAKPLMDQKAIYAGCYVRADINPFPYSNSGNHGVGWGLNNIMLVEQGERLDGRQNAEDAFSGFIESDSDGGELM
jgi:hypothetical protein